MKNRRMILIGLLLIICASALYIRRAEVSQAICEGPRGGVWASNGAECITLDCYYADGYCGTRSFPALHCPEVKIGDHITFVLLHLGSPLDVQGNTYSWPYDKLNSDAGITAVFRNDWLVALDCPAYPFTDMLD